MDDNTKQNFFTRFFQQDLNHDLDSLRKRWIKSHVRISITVFFITVITEIAFYFLYKDSSAPNYSNAGYIRNYILFPICINCLIISVMRIIQKSQIADKHKVYAISLLFAFFVFIINIVHCVYPIILITFIVPVLLTVVYSNEILTNITAVFSLILEIIAEFFITWDSDKPAPFGSTDNIATIIVAFIAELAIYEICRQILKFEIIKLKLSKDFEIEKYHLMEEAMKDSLTGINNRKALSKHLEDIEHNKLPEDTFIFAMIDLDNFKKINDNLGHEEGDHILKIASSIIQKDAQLAHGTAFRYGGDEFVLIFRNVAYNQIFNTCLHIKHVFERSLPKEIKELKASMSFGLAEASGSDDITHKMILADNNMYEYKKQRKDYSR